MAAIAPAACRAWLDYAVSGDIAALIDYFDLLEQNQGELAQIHSGYPEVAVGEDLPGPALARLRAAGKQSFGRVTLLD